MKRTSRGQTQKIGKVKESEWKWHAWCDDCPLFYLVGENNDPFKHMNIAIDESRKRIYSCPNCGSKKLNRKLISKSSQLLVYSIKRKENEWPFGETWNGNTMAQIKRAG